MRKVSPWLTRIFILLSVTSVVVLPVACSSPAPSPVTSPPAATTPAAPITTPLVIPPPTATSLTAAQVYYSIHINSPSPFMLIPTGDVTITVRVDNFKLVDKVGQPTVLGEGHIIYYQDADTPIDRTKTAIPTFGEYATSTSPTYTWKNVPIGTRTFSAQLVNNDNTPLGIPTYDAITAIVVPAATGPGLAEPLPSGQSDVGTSRTLYYNSATQQATVSVSATNFQISGNIGLADQAGQGHYAFYMDEDAPTVAGKPGTTATSVVTASNFNIWKNVSAGPHTFSVQLLNNDNTPLSPPVVYKIAVNTQTYAP